MRDTPDRLRTYAIGVWAIVGGVVVLAVAAWALLQIRILWLPLVAATAIVYLLNPSVTFLRRHGLHRAIGSVLVYLVVVVLMGSLGSVVLPVISAQATDLVDQLPIIYGDSVVWLSDSAAGLGFDDLQLMTYDELVASVFSPGEDLDINVNEVLGQAFDVALTFIEGVALLFVTPVIAFYLLIGVPRLQKSVVDLIPERYQMEASRLGSNLGKAFGGFVRGQLLVAIVVGSLVSVGLYFLGMDLWLIMGLLAALFNLVPFVGPWISGSLTVLVALVLGDLALAAGVVVLFLAVQQVENHLVSPLILRATVHLDPVLIISALLVGGSVGGFVGLVLAVPVTALSKILIAHFWRTRVLGQSWEEASDLGVIEYSPPSPESMAGRLRRIGRLQLSQPAVSSRGDRQDPH